MHHAFHLAVAQAHAAELQRIAAAVQVAPSRRRGARVRAATATAGLAAVLLMFGGCGGSNDVSEATPMAADGRAAAVKPQVVKHTQSSGQ